MNGKKNLFIGLIILAVVGILVFLLLLVTGKGKVTLSDSFSRNSFVKVNSLYEFFEVEAIANTFYSYVGEKDSNKLFNSLDKEYINANNVTEGNVLVYFKEYYDSIDFNALEVYKTSKKSKNYYIVRGYIINSRETDDLVSYKKSVTLFISSSNNKFSVYPLSDNNDWMIFVDSYKVEANVKLYATYTYKSLDEVGRLRLYISRYLNLLYLDKEKAYDMLGKKTKEYYGSYSNFVLLIDELYSTITPMIFSYNYEDNAVEKKYTIVDDKENIITIYEKNPMDYMLDIEFK